MSEEELKQTIKESKIVDLKDLAIMFHTKEVSQFDMITVFKTQEKQILEEQVIAWEEMLSELTMQYQVSVELSKDLNEDNQNELIAEMMTLKECKFMSYKLSLQIDYYKVCIELMKKIIKNK